MLASTLGVFIVISVRPLGRVALPAVALVVIEAEVVATWAEAEASEAIIKLSVVSFLMLASLASSFWVTRSPKPAEGAVTLLAKNSPVTIRSPLMVTRPLLSMVTRPAKKLMAPWPEGWIKRVSEFKV